MINRQTVKPSEQQNERKIILADILDAGWTFFRALFIIAITVLCFVAVSIFWPLAVILIVLFPISFLAFGDWMGKFKVF